MRRPAIALIRLWQWGLAPLLGPHCRFSPSCSERMRLSIEREGVLRGVRLGLAQIVRCHPWGGA